MELVVSLRIAKTIIGLFGIIGNSLICLVVFKVPTLHGVTNTLICHQAVIDFLSCVFMVCQSLIPSSSVPEGVAGSLFCQLWDAPVLTFALLTASTFNLMVITLERYVAIIFPFRYLRLVNRNTTIILMCGVWILSLTYKLNDMFRYGVDAEGNCTTYDVQWKKGLGIVQFSIEYFVPLIAMMFAYGHIMMVLKKTESRLAPMMLNLASLQQRQPQNDTNQDQRNTTETADVTIGGSIRRARHNTFKTLLLVYIAFLICWTPNSFIFLLWNLGYRVDNSSVMYRVTVIMAASNSAINFVIYGFKYRKFRKGLRFVFCGRDNRVEPLSLDNTTRSVLGQ